ANMSEPVKFPGFSQNLNDGYFNSKYKNYSKFAIMWENIGVDTFTSDIEYNKKCFLENVAPFWIEYFFKDPRYYKVNGRPLVGAYYLWKISEKFGDEGFKEMLTEFEQMCVDAGVGKPFFIQQVSKDAGTKDFYKRVEEWGASGSYAYNHGNIWPELMYDWNEEFEADAKETNIQFIPSVNPGFDAFPWGLDVGSLWNKDNMKTFLVNIRDKFFKTADTSILGRKILMLCSWNEFNEGHYFCPTQGTGFSFLDAVREVFVGDTPHEDVVPTTHQLDRINNLYPSDRVTPTREAAVDNNIPKNSYIKAGWYFDKGLGEWNKGSGIKSCETSDDGLKITTTKGDTSIYVIPKNLEISNVSHIKIKIKNNSSANDLKLKYLTKTNESPNNQQYRTYIKPNLDEYTDVVIDVRKYPELWKGVAEKLQIEFSTVKDNEKIEIKSVELFAQDKAEDAEKLTLSINGWEQKVDSTVIDNRLYVPLRTISDSFKGSVYWDPNTENIYMNVLDRKVVISPNSDTFTIDDEKITMANFKITQEDTTYVSLDFLATMFKKDVKWIDEKNLLEISDITSIDISQPNSERSVLYEADFNVDGNSQGYYLINANGDVSNGVYNITYDAGDPIVYAPDLSGLRLDTANAKMFAIGIKSNKDFDARVYFNTDKHRGISESQAFSFKVNASGETKEYSTLIKNPNWEGKLTGFRFDPGDFINNSIQIEYIKIYGDFDSILTKDEILMRYNSMKVSDEMISWDMNINNKKDGWEFNKSIVNVETKDGWTNFLTLENDATMNTIDVGKIEASDVKTIEMRLKNLTNGTKAKIYYKTDKSNVYDDSKAFYVDIKKNDEIGSIYTIDVSKSEKWEGEITGLKFSPSDEVGEISVDYINLLKK
ncbi:MAG: stalk domain-containing protein, partial [Oscillospiraceae bacterium]